MKEDLIKDLAIVIEVIIDTIYDSKVINIVRLTEVKDVTLEGVIISDWLEKDCIRLEVMLRLMMVYAKLLT